LKFDIKILNFEEALNQMYRILIDKEYGVLKSFNEIDVIGHRVVHGGEKYTRAVLLNDEIIKDINELSKLAPLHNKNSIEIISKCMKQFPSIENIAVFDTSFHSSISKENFIYSLPKELYEKYKL